MLTAEQSQFVSGYAKPTTKVQSLQALGNKGRKLLRDEVLDILRAAHLHGAADMTVGEIADQYQTNNSRFKPPSSFSQVIEDLQVAKLMQATSERVYVGTGRRQMAYRLVAQQTRMVR